MGKIHVLDVYTANQIAAGEVVERPVSVIKELVENSIDARSTAITIEIRDGGNTFIRVTDNGTGIDQDDVSIAFERHTTSKIMKIDDLYKTYSLGFRGEALASIAAVSQLEMITRTRNSESGISVINNGGEIKEIKEVGCPEGTTILVRNLFYNTPARLKFLKKVGVEAGYVGDIITRLILAHPHISFKFINNNKVIYHTPGDGDLHTAIYSIYGKEIASSLYKIHLEEENVKIWGYVGNSETVRGNRTYQSFIVNGRYIKSTNLSKAVETAYNTMITINRFPLFVIHIELPQDRLDVNIHPNKTTIRFIEEEKIQDILQRAVHRALIDNPYIPSAFIQEKDIIQRDANVKEDANANFYHNVSSKKELYQNEEKEDSIMDASYHEEQVNYINIPSKMEKSKIEKKPEEESIFYLEKDNNTNDPPYSSDFTIIGQLFATYLLVEKDEKLYIIDQHAAHERILYERYRNMLWQGQVSSQQLLVPYIIEVTHWEKENIEAQLNVINEMGFNLEEFGNLSYQIRSVPYILGQPQIKEFFRELVDNLENIKMMSSLEAKQDTIMQLACKKAVKAGDVLKRLEIEELLRIIKDEAIPLTCPHGRPIVISLTNYDLEKRFKRVQ